MSSVLFRVRATPVIATVDNGFTGDWLHGPAQIRTIRNLEMRTRAVAAITR
jgi:hypothetical protein